MSWEQLYNGSQGDTVLYNVREQYVLRSQTVGGHTSGQSASQSQVAGGELQLHGPAHAVLSRTL